MNLSVPSARTARRSSRARYLRGFFAGAAVVAFAAVVVGAPVAKPDIALADQAFYQRIHQEFQPVDAGELAIHLEAAPAKQLPEPEPEPGPEPTPVAAPAIPKYTGGGSPAQWMSDAGIAESDWGYVDYIVSRESGWNPNATNSSSGACGLVQAYPCSKVPGSGYDPVDNLRWANGYAVGRYGSWKDAVGFWTENHWW